MAELSPSTVEIGPKGVKVTGNDILTTAGVAILVLLGYVLWEHKEDTKITHGAFVGAVRDMAASQREMTQAQRVQNCLLATRQDDREAKLPTCERLAR